MKVRKGNKDMQKKIETKVWHVDKNVEEKINYSQIVDAARVIRDGELLAFPTETVYGLGANALSDEAVEKIYTAKGRPSDNPLIVHIGSLSQLSAVASFVPPKALKLIEAFWPGPLTLFLPKTEAVAGRVTAGLDTVGVRMPDHPLALALIQEAGVPIAAPSANRSGRPSPTSAAHVLADLDGRIAGVLDGGPTGVGVESTTIDMTAEPPVIHRPGGITYEQIKAVIGEVLVDAAVSGSKQAQPLSPGMKYTHYAPEGQMWIVSGEAAAARQQMLHMLAEAKREGKKTGVLAVEEKAEWWRRQESADVVISCGSSSELESVARELYSCLRQFDDHQVEFIVSEAFPTSGIGLAVMNRLEKAAGGRIIRV
jgi:L-threonylcarbamoyladenylate synthase